ncbi:MAG: DUF302 domain-containing protein [Methylococcales bacterium]|jgi:uncharacterized protein (DUF302 family)|nr:DUF302 domain-containing protein [Methylococcales bacterium]
MKKLFLMTLGFIFLGCSHQVMAEKFQLSDECAPTVMNMIKCQVAEDVSSDDAIASMQLRANILNFKLVGHLPLSKQVKVMGGKSERMEIFQFCDALIAVEMVKYNMAFSGYLPCRITLVEEKGRTYLITLNMDKMLGEAGLPKELVSLGVQVRNNIYSIITAGTEGDL